MLGWSPTRLDGRADGWLKNRLGDLNQLDGDASATQTPRNHDQKEDVGPQALQDNPRRGDTERPKEMNPSVCRAEVAAELLNYAAPQVAIKETTMPSEFITHHTGPGTLVINQSN